MHFNKNNKQAVRLIFLMLKRPIHKIKDLKFLVKNPTGNYINPSPTGNYTYGLANTGTLFVPVSGSALCATTSLHKTAPNVV